MVNDLSPTRKTPEIGATFWLMMFAATTLGGIAGDVSWSLHEGHTVRSVTVVTLCAVILAVQLTVRRYLPPVYWSAFVATATAGSVVAMMSAAEMGEPKRSALLVMSLAGTLWFWRSRSGSLADDEIKSRREEIPYWIAILFSNALGAALGDALAAAGLGFIKNALLIGGLLTLLLAGALFTSSRVLLFWAALVLARPLGANIVDALAKPHDQGGLDLGTAGVAAILATILVQFVVRAWILERRKPEIIVELRARTASVSPIRRRVGPADNSPHGPN